MSAKDHAERPMAERDAEPVEDVSVSAGTDGAADDVKAAELRKAAPEPERAAPADAAEAEAAAEAKAEATPKSHTEAKAVPPPDAEVKAVLEPEPEPEPEPESESPSEPPAEPAPEPAGEAPTPEPVAAATSAQAPQVRRAMRWRTTRNQLLIATLCGLLGFALALQVRSNQTADTLRTARQSDLVRILDDLEERSSRLRAEARDLETTRDRLTSGFGSRETAIKEANERADTLGILAGRLPATGPGIELVISDPAGKITGAILLDALQELRDAGAEAVQIDDVRVVASTHFTDSDEGVRADGTPLASPYRFIAIGDPATMASALDIPGGVLDRVKKEGAEAEVRQQASVSIEAVHLQQDPEYARPAPQPT